MESTINEKNYQDYSGFALGFGGYSLGTLAISVVTAAAAILNSNHKIAFVITSIFFFALTILFIKMCWRLSKIASHYRKLYEEELTEKIA